jgi:hypothetical protein
MFEIKLRQDAPDVFRFWLKYLEMKVNKTLKFNLISFYWTFPIAMFQFPISAQASLNHKAQEGQADCCSTTCNWKCSCGRSDSFHGDKSKARNEFNLAFSFTSKSSNSNLNSLLLMAVVSHNVLRDRVVLQANLITSQFSSRREEEKLILVS